MGISVACMVTKRRRVPKELYADKADTIVDALHGFVLSEPIRYWTDVRSPSGEIAAERRCASDG